MSDSSATAGASTGQQIGREFVDALNAGDAEALDRLFADDVTWTFPGNFAFSGKHEGKSSVFENFLGPAGALFEPPADPPIELRNVIAQGDTVAVEYVARMRSAIGRPYENFYVITLDIADGEIKNVREYNDTSHLLEACFE